MQLAELIFVAAFCVTVYFAREAWRVWHSPEFKHDLARLRENRRLRKAATRRKNVR